MTLIKKTYTITLAFFVLVFCCTSVTLLTPNRTLKSYIEKVEGPSSGKKGKKIPFTLTTHVANSYGYVSKVKSSKSGFEITVHIETKYQNKICAEIATEKSTIYKFCERKAGTYTIKFLSKKRFITKIMEIE